MIGMPVHKECTKIVLGSLNEPSFLFLMLFFVDFLLKCGFR